jgi:hypothetical protein
MNRCATGRDCRSQLTGSGCLRSPECDPAAIGEKAVLLASCFVTCVGASASLKMTGRVEVHLAEGFALPPIGGACSPSLLNHLRLLACE